MLTAGKRELLKNAAGRFINCPAFLFHKIEEIDNWKMTCYHSHRTLYTSIYSPKTYPKEVIIMGGTTVFSNLMSGETLIHRDRVDGMHDLKIVKTGVSGDRGGHSVFDRSGNPVFIRDTDGSITADDSR
ncbi:MAG: hypothetical protein Q7R98_01150 [Candidatus Jorgensenbacteria bacterium]|nr:hypothetical protein [Candidatus Jorgensenbacteria bacterium]